MYIKKLKITFVIVIGIMFFAGLFSYILYLIHRLPRLENKDSIIPNVYLERAIRKAINKPTGEITPEDCIGITEMDLSHEDYYTSLEGLQYFVDLEVLTSAAGYIRDISALKDLKKLKKLNLYLNQIEDISPLAELENLEYLNLSSNRIKDISPLSSLTKLKTLVIYKNYVEDFSSLDNIDGLSIHY